MTMLAPRTAAGQTTTTRGLMYQLLLALLPGTAVMTYHFGIGVLVNVCAACLAALLFEFIALKLRQLPTNALADGSALITGALLGLALPPLLPVWITAIGVGFAILLAKHAYGGLGQNIFNPAMAGYAVLIVSFPLAMTEWSNPALPFMEAMSMKLGGTLPDGYTMATPLDQFKFRGAQTAEEYWSATTLANWQVWLTINLAFLASGGYLVYRKVCGWHAPAAMLGTLALLSALFYDSGSSQSLGSPLFHLLGGATMLGAFFIVTDPVTSPESVKGQLLFGAGIGILTFIIRATGAYPEGLAFAVLLMNGVTPLINHLTFRL
jgi:Na+-translocating ferredoxin:NAD+ oxidoreductase subunit D